MFTPTNVNFEKQVKNFLCREDNTSTTDICKSE